ncbi:hypothetical protein [Streptomyces sp. 5-10]|uniref:hypothetical protein n=1 Tax=Streptomyces sp. 5-10 TaxID=878925 RepID=UPI00168C0058|nr:hypothetical protein [Streptomyces sp. 5-10]MBD3004815.1 hypothetical protein [Streptomyces sp. 5-10]
MNLNEIQSEIQNGMRIYPVICSFYVRTPSEDGKYHYDRLSVKGRHGDGNLHTFHPPHTGESISLRDEFGNFNTTGFRVIHRDWLHSSYGSVNWPYMYEGPKEGPRLNVIVEPFEGPFENESELKSPIQLKQEEEDGE